MEVERRGKLSCRLQEGEDPVLLISGRPEWNKYSSDFSLHSTQHIAQLTKGSVVC